MFKNIETENPFNDYEAIITELSLIRAKDKEFKHDEKLRVFGQEIKQGNYVFMIKYQSKSAWVKY